MAGGSTDLGRLNILFGSGLCVSPDPVRCTCRLVQSWRWKCRVVMSGRVERSYAPRECFVGLRTWRCEVSLPCGGCHLRLCTPFAVPKGITASPSPCHGEDNAALPSVVLQASLVVALDALACELGSVQLLRIPAATSIDPTRYTRDHCAARTSAPQAHPICKIEYLAGLFGRGQHSSAPIMAAQTRRSLPWPPSQPPSPCGCSEGMHSTTEPQDSSPLRA